MPSNVSPTRVCRARGMTLVETLISALIVISFFAIISVVSASLGAHDARTRTQHTLSLLQQALADYPDPLPGETHDVLSRLLAHPSTAATLDAIAIEWTSQNMPIVRDAYGHRLVYQPNGAGQRVGQFISPGPDGQLGDAFSQDPATRRAAADNLYGSDTEDSLP